MANIQTQSFGVILQNAVTAVQGAAAQLLDFTVGSVLRALLESVSAMALWLQGIALQIASLTRFSTSNGADADSWAADFDFPRLPAVAAKGPVTFSRLTPTQQALIPVGTFVQTADLSQKYEVVPDTSQPAYDPVQAAYIIPANTASITATIEAVVASSAGNAGAGFINTLASSIPGVDSVTNPAAFEDGADAETDPAFRARFILYIAGLSKATPASISSQIADLQQGMVSALTENQNFDGSPNRGYFYAVVDDGSGNPSPTLLASAANAIDAVRPIGSTFSVFGPSVVTANISMAISVAAGFDKPTLQTAVQTALLKYVSALSIEVSLPYTRLAQIAYDVSPGITNVTGVLLNGGTADLTANNQQAIRAGTITVS